MNDTANRSSRALRPFYLHRSDGGSGDHARVFAQPAAVLPVCISNARANGVPGQGLRLLDPDNTKERRKTVKVKVRHFNRTASA
jgi:hypothetical protein